MNRKYPTNTTHEANTNPMLVLLDAMMMGGSGAIERSEQRGQQELIESDTIPSSFGRYNDKAEGERKLLEMGFVLGDPVPGDDMFRFATLPPGWKKVVTDHSMWSKIVDETGKERCSIFYKAAFYDRSAHLSICEKP